MSDRTYNTLFLCTGNSARSVLAEALLNRHGRGRFRGYSAGSHPKGQVHPLTLEILRRHNYPVDAYRSKDWAEFASPDAPRMDFVITVCDSAAAEQCPVWPGQPVSAHWGLPDPAAVEGDWLTRIEAFRAAFHVLERRIEVFTSLPVASLDRLRLQQQLASIGKM
jgi:protein-tyrosine-phosphatase